MRTVCKDVYKYAELSERAKEKARDWYRYGPGASYPWSGETQDTLKAFEKALPIKIKNYSYGEGGGRDFISFEVTDQNVEEIKGLRLRTWLINNFIRNIEKGKYQSTAGTYDDAGKYQYKKRYSNVTKEISCPFTGVCFDEDIIDAVREFVDRFNPRRDSEKTFREIVEECFDGFARAVASDIEGQNEDDAVAETIEANEYEFNEDGTRYK